ncbi:MAG: hypothetical protein ACYC7D_07080 [Nitrososphaerales archaeon]
MISETGRAMKGRRRSSSGLLRLLQFVVISTLIGYVIGQMIQEGLLGREIFQYASGIHWCSIVIFLFMFLAYMLRDKASLLYLPLIMMIYYAIHEAQFNFFLSYHGFNTPPEVNWTWHCVWTGKRRS